MTLTSASAIFLLIGFAFASDSPSARQNFDTRVEDLLNDLLNEEYEAFYFFESIATYFQKPSVGLMGFRKYFHEAAHEEREITEKIIGFINMRGGTVVLKSINLPSVTAKLEWPTASKAVQAAMTSLKGVNEKILSAHKTAGEMNDPSTQDYLDNFLMEKVDAIAKLRTLLSRLERVQATGLADFLIDQELIRGK